MASNKRETYPEVYIPLGTFDKSKLVSTPVVMSTYTTKEKARKTSYSSYLLYPNDEGTLGIPLIETPDLFTFGVNFKLPFNSDPKKGTLDKAEGFQICVCLTSKDTIEKPTKDEKYFMQVLDALNDVTWNRLAEESKRKKKNIPLVSSGAYIQAIQDGEENRDMALKPIYSHPKEKEDKDKLDTSQPVRMYLPFITSGKGNEIINKTLIYGPGNKKKNPISILNLPAMVKCAVACTGLFWGAHGTSSYGVSVRLRVNDMNWTPVKLGIEPTRRLGPNTAVADEHDSDEENTEDSTFPNPKNSLKEPKKNTPQPGDVGFKDEDDENPKPKGRSSTSKPSPPPPETDSEPENTSPKKSKAVKSSKSDNSAKSSKAPKPQSESEDSEPEPPKKSKKEAAKALSEKRAQLKKKAAKLRDKDE